MKNILITGGAGFIGSNLSLELIKKGYKVTILDNLSPQIHGNEPLKTSPLYQAIINEEMINFIKGDVTSEKDLVKAIENQDIIVHLAAETGTGQSMYKIKHYIDVNIGGTSLLLDILANKKHGVKKIIVASSRAIYGEGKYFSKEFGFVYPEARIEKDMNAGIFEVRCAKTHTPLQLVATDEESKIHPTSVYGITKYNQEQMVMTVCPTIGISPVAFRYQNVYGPGQSLSNPYTGILSIFSTQIKNKRPINIFEDGLESRDFVFIEDVVKVTILGIESDSANGHVFNIGTGNATTVLDVAKGLIENYGIETPCEITGNYRLGDIRHNFADITKLKNILGFEPKYSFNEGLKQFAKWVDGQQIQNSKYDLSIDEMKSKGLFK